MSGGTRSPLKVALTASAGATVEWYDFFIYGTAAALVFPKLFFPADLPPFVAQIGAFATFAVGFFARPVGGAVFGHFGDMVGRKRALVTALVTMGLATAAIGLLPSYAQAGVFAPLLLVALRFIQGFAVGGQWGGAALLAIESAPPGRRGYFSSFVQIGVPLGVLLANVVFLIMGALVATDAFLAWGWRIPFLASLLLVGIGLYVQLHLEESAEFEERAGAAEAAPKSSPILEVFARHPREVLLAGGAFIANNTCFYIAITYVVAYGTATLNLSRGTMLAAVMIGSAIMVPALILCGWVSDHWGRRRPFMWGAALCGLWAFAFFPLIETGSPALIALSVSVALVLISMMYGPQAALFAELFPVELRYSGASLGYQLGSVLGGGLAPIVATALFEQFKSTGPIAIYLAATCAVSLACTAALVVRAPHGSQDLQETGAPGASA
ncbi:MAG: MHS family MFS transporter [Phenylobacterium sp.]|uniref:MFS transporter n=1 Tax=Phenylobacterium sp. TaxID=1871053 RepID=UPI001A3C1E35|nr:MFS transporter [Phenylobacterium sp.]MBL8556504.1 MHS family MFS transporter [Phenylobacterium sp.]